MYSGLIYPYNTMPEEKKEEKSPAVETVKDKPEAESKPKQEEKPAKKVAEKAQDALTEASARDEKTTLEEITEETEKKPAGKKGRSDMRELKSKDIKPGMIVRVHQKIVDTNSKGEEKERIQVFQGMVITHKHGTEPGATITVRKVSGGIGVEKIFPLSMPSISKIELVRKYRVRQARPYFLRDTKKRLREIKE